MNKRLSFLGKDGADSSASLRMNLYEQFYDYWQDHWLWGAGLNNFRHLYSMRFGTLTYSHNTFTEILVGIGVWGSLAYLLFFFCPFYLSYKRYRQTRSGLFLILFAGHLGFLVISMGQRMYANVPMMCFFALSMALTGPCFKYFTKFGINERYNSIR